MLTSITALNMTNILQGNVVIIIKHSRWANYTPYFLQCTSAKNYESWMTVDKVIAIITRLTFLAHSVYAYIHLLMY